MLPDRRFALAGLLAAGALALGACGGEDPDPQAAPPTEEGRSGDEAPSTEAGPDTDEDRTEPGRSTEAFCERIEEGQAIGDRFGDLDVTDLEGTQEAFGEATESFERASEVAPQEIRADVEQIERVVGDISSAVNEADSAQQLQERLVGSQEAFAGLREPAERLATFQEENCEAGSR